MTTTDPLVALWQQSADPAPAVDPARLDALKADAARLDRTLRWRDVREVGAAAFIVLGFGGMALVWDEVRVPAFALAAVGVWIAAVMLVVRVRTRRPGPDVPLRQALAAEVAWLDGQIALLRWAWLWYVLPLLLGFIAFESAGGSPRRLFILIAGGVAFELARLNWKAAAGLRPTRDAFAAVLSGLPDTDTAAADAATPPTP